MNKSARGHNNVPLCYNMTKMIKEEYQTYSEREKHVCIKLCGMLKRTGKVSSSQVFIRPAHCKLYNTFDEYNW